MPIEAGTQLGPYEILGPIGSGGMGEVYRAKDMRLGRNVAIKVLPAEFSSNPDRLSRFEQEARSSSSLNHPNIIAIYDIGSAESHSYIAMELIEGRTLRETLESGPLPPRKAITIAAQLANGLSKAHEAGIVHRDLKPENIMISRDGFVKILDFGLAKPAATNTRDASDLATIAKTDAGIIVGTVGYMSPEQAAGKAIDYHSDQFSFGSILYEMVTGRRAFQRGSAVQTMSAIIQEDPEPVGASGRQTPAPVRWIIERCLAKDPEERYASTRDLSRELRSVQDHFSDLGSSTEIAVAPPALQSRQWLRLWSLASLLIIAGLTAALIINRQQSQEPPVLRTLTFSGHDSSPAASPDGKIIAFTSTRDGVSRIWLKQLIGGGEVALTGGPDNHPRFSPDGSTVLFIRTEGSKGSLYRIPLLGGEPRRIIEHADFGDWSPDGKSLAFTRFEQTASGSYRSSLWVSGAAGENPHELAAENDRMFVAPRWSPDSRKIAVNLSAFGTALNLAFWITPDGKERHSIAPSETLGTLSSMVWSGTGENLIFTQLEQVSTIPGLSSGRVLSTPANGGRSKTLFWAQNLYGGDPFIPQGWQGTIDIPSPGRVVFDSIISRQNLAQIDLQNQETSTGLSWLTRGNSSDRQPSYSPDGEWVIFSSTRSGNLDLWKMSTKTGTVVRVTDDTAQDWDPTFTHDGKSILWSSDRSGHYEIWTANTDGSAPRALSQDGVDAENPTETTDGRWIVYNSYNPKKSGVWKIKKENDGAAAVQLASGTTHMPEISPDGEYVSYTHSDGRILMSRMDGTAVPFYIRLGGQPGIAGRARWWTTQRIMFLDVDEKGVPAIYVQDFLPGADTASTRHLLAGVPSNLLPESFGLSPDGSRLTISFDQTYSSLVLAERVPGVSPPRQK